MNGKDGKGMLDLRARWATDLGLGANPTAQFGAPVSFTAHLESILPGATQVMATSGLANGYRTPYVIDEIRMQAYTLDAGIALQQSYAMQFQFRTGAYAFSRVPVPMMLHAPLYGGFRDGPAPLNSLQSTFTGGGIRNGDDARWLLAKPLWMGPGDQIQCSVLRDAVAAASGNAPFSADVTYVGRSLPPGSPGPSIRYVPWIAHYVHDFDNLYSETTTQFRNPFTFPMTVQRLIGRPMNKSASGTFPVARFYMQQGISSPQWVKLSIEDSLGYKITRDFSDAAAVFDSERCSWTFSRPLGAREQLNMKFRTVANQSLGTLFGVAMHGYREETGR